MVDVEVDAREVVLGAAVVVGSAAVHAPVRRSTPDINASAGRRIDRPFSTLRAYLPPMGYLRPCPLGPGTLGRVNDRQLLHPLAEAFEIEPDRTDVVVLLHGWTGSPSHMRLLGADLAAAGFGVVAPLLPGHGTHVDDLVKTGWRDWVRAGAEAALRVEESGRRLHLAGLSMGGLLGVLLAVPFPVASLTTINSPIHIYSRSAALARLTRGSQRVRHDPPQERHPDFAHDYAHHYEGTPLGAVADLFDVMRASKRALPLVGAPALVVQSQMDETVRPSSGTYLYQRLGSPFKRLVWLERSAHLATLDIERDRIAEELVRHLRDAQGLASLHPDLPAG